MGKLLTDEEREQRMAEDLWLNYFNRYLFEGGHHFREGVQENDRKDCRKKGKT